MNNKRAVFELFLVSALTLFVELIFIRWAASEVRMLAFYKNFALIAAFLGIGLGFAYRQRSPNKRLFERYFFPLLTASVILLLLFGRTSLSDMILLNRSGAEEYIWAGTIDIQNPFVNTLLDVSFYATLMLLYLVITVLFIPLGELTSRKFSTFEPLPGYTINILGSVTGILIYTGVSFLEWSPPAWYLFVCVSGLYYVWKMRPSLMIIQYVCAVLPILLTFLWSTGAERTLWSPYYRIDINAQYAPNNKDILLGYELAVNKAWHQRMWNLDASFVAQNYTAAPQHFDNYLIEYDAPFQVSNNLNNVLIVGAGAGNDVAAVERVHEGADCEKLLAGPLTGVSDHDRLAAAQGQTRQRRLARHGARQIDRVASGRRAIRIAAPAAASKRGAAQGRVDRHDHLDPRVARDM